MGEVVIDTLIVQLGLDPADFSKNSKDAAAGILKMRNDADRTAKDMQASGKRAAEFYSGIKKEALGAFAVITGANGLKNFTAQTVTNFAAIDRAAQSMGVNVSKLAQFQMMVVRNGGDAKSATAELQNMSKAMEEWKATGNTAMLPWLNRIGANANDDPFAVFEKFSKWGEGKDAKLVNLVGGNLGFDQETINQAMKGQAAYQAEMKRSRELGAPSDDDVKKVGALQRKFAELKQSVTGDAQALVEEFAPALGLVLDLAVKADHAVPGLTTSILALTAAWTGLNSLKLGTTALKILSGAAKAAPVAEEAVAAGGGLGLAGALAAPLAFGFAAFAPSQANKGENAALARARAAWKVKPGDKGYDEDMAIRTLIGEARSGDQRGMTDVAHVIRNRMKASNKSATDVVLQKGQFEPWMTDASRSRLMGISKDDPRYKMAMAAWMASQHEADPTGGATLFVSPQGQAANGRNMPAWADPKNLKLARGGHQFYSGGFPGGGGPPIIKPSQTTVNRNVTVGAVTINTAATDAKGIAQDFTIQLNQRQLMDQSNTGLE